MLVCLATTAAACYVQTAVAADLESIRVFDIKPQLLETALIEYSRQSEMQVIGATDTLADARSRGVVGTLSNRAALQALLEQTSLRFDVVGAHTVRIAAGIQQIANAQPMNDRGAAKAQVVAAASADPALAAMLTQVVVTATRQAQTINRVPISITALTQESLEQRGIKQIDDLARITPGINFGRDYAFGAGNRSQISIRGIESFVGASTTGIYIDDTPIQTRNAGYTSTSVFPVAFDLARVEVLRGPQGTLFGAGSMGGTVRFVTSDPSVNEHSAFARTELKRTRGGDLSYEGGMSVGGPIAEDRLGFRASAFFQHEGGWIDRVDRNSGATLDERQNAAESVALRAALTWVPTDGLRITSSVYYQDLDLDGGAGFWESLSDPGAGRFRTGNALGGPSSDKFVLPALKIEYDLARAQIISNTSYLDRDTVAYPDYTQIIRAITTGQPYALIPGEFSKGHFIDRQHGFTQELRIQSQNPNDRWNWVTGLFYNKTRQVDIEIVESPFFPQLVLDTFGVDYMQIYGTPMGAMNSVFTDQQRTVDEQIAVFGQVDYGLTDKLKATLGLRYARIDFDFKSENEGPHAGLGVDAGKQSEEPLTPKLGLAYQADADNLFYASAAKGFRPGGAQRIPPASCAGDLAALGMMRPPATYDADSVWSYELGAKNRLLDGRLQLNSSAFWIDWSNIQQFIDLPNCGQSLVGNLGKAVSRGFDIAVNALLGNDFTLSLAAGYTDAYFTQTVKSGPALVVVEGDATSGISPWVATLTGRYDFTLVGNDAFAQLDYDRTSQGPKPAAAVFGRDPIAFGRPRTHLLSARAGVTLRDINVTLFVENLLNSDTQLSRTRDIPTSPLFIGSTFRPRAIGLTVSYSY